MTCCSNLHEYEGCCSSRLQVVAASCMKLQDVASSCRLLQQVADCCSRLQVVAAGCRLLHQVADCCIKVQGMAVRWKSPKTYMCMRFRTVHGMSMFQNPHHSELESQSTTVHDSPGESVTCCSKLHHDASGCIDSQYE